MIYICTCMHTLKNVGFLVRDMSNEHGLTITQIRKIAPILNNLSPITYIFYQDIKSIHQCHRLQSSGWTSNLA